MIFMTSGQNMSCLKISSVWTNWNDNDILIYRSVKLISFIKYWEGNGKTKLFGVKTIIKCIVLNKLTLEKKKLKQKFLSSQLSILVFKIYLLKTAQIYLSISVCFLSLSLSIYLSISFSLSPPLSLCRNIYIYIYIHIYIYIYIYIGLTRMIFIFHRKKTFCLLIYRSESLKST